ncbi:hypothetical protein BDZ94DRAFT_594294 [Collybia nuda]|uniref:Uncharacterized protein n=1 Tax=Collybia nuda TaxID=64659 RepID=A0A9P6CF78_9AGAR|nr:hypothetical protein BDZ94DRAFT_594294 [Collybia nuda]
MQGYKYVWNGVRSEIPTRDSADTNSYIARCACSSSICAINCETLSSAMSALLDIASAVLDRASTLCTSASAAFLSLSKTYQFGQTSRASCVSSSTIFFWTSRISTPRHRPESPCIKTSASSGTCTVRFEPTSQRSRTRRVRLANQ